MSYGLGIDLGTTFTAAAVARDGHVEVATFGYQATSLPTVVVLAEDGTFVVGHAAERRGAATPERLVREFKRRVGDPTPIQLGGTPVAVDRLLAEVLAHVRQQVTEAEGGEPAGTVVTHPATWGGHKRDALTRAIDLAGLGPATLLAEPVAAATWYASAERLEPGATVAIYDLGGGTFDAAVLAMEADGRFAVRGRPEGLDRLGGIDVDALVLAHVLRTAGVVEDELDPDDEAHVAGLVRLRRDCVDTKEALSSDTTATILVDLAGRRAQVLLRRSELEELAAPLLTPTVQALRRVVASAGLAPGQLDAVLLVGGASRMPLVGREISAALGRPTAVDAHPKHPVALGAALVAAERAGLAPTATAAPAGPAPQPAGPLGIGTGAGFPPPAPSLTGAAPAATLLAPASPLPLPGVDTAVLAPLAAGTDVFVPPGAATPPPMAPARPPARRPARAGWGIAVAVALIAGGVAAWPDGDPAADTRTKDEPASTTGAGDAVPTGGSGTATTAPEDTPSIPPPATVWDGFAGFNLGGPVIDAERVYTMGSDTHVSAWGATTGGLVWEASVGHDDADADLVLAEGVLVVTPRRPAETVGIDAASGEVLWRVPGLAGHRPLVVGDAVVVEDGTRARSIGLADGVVRWDVDLAAAGAAPTSGFALAGDAVVAGTSGAEVVALGAADGAVRWRRPVPVGATGEVVDVAVAGDVVLARGTSWVAGLPPGDGEPWRTDIGAPAAGLDEATAALGSDVAVLGGGSRLYLLDAASGEERVQRRDTDGTLHPFGDDPPLLLVAGSGGLTAVTAGDAAVAWQLLGAAPLRGAALAGDLLATTDDAGNVTVYRT